jgi:hypothetical protein
MTNISIGKTLGILLIAICIKQACYAQSDFSLGIKAGISIPNLKPSGDDPVSSGWSSIQGPYGGLLAELRLSDNFFLQGELNYATQGGKKSGVQAFPSSPFAPYFPPGLPVPKYLYAVYDAHIKLNYLEFPVVLKVNFFMGEAFSIFIDGGVYAGYLLKAKSTSSGTSNIYLDENLTQPLLSNEVSFDQSLDIKSDLKKFNFGVQAGFGMAYYFFNANKLVLTAGGNYGLVPIQKDEANGKNNTGAATVTLAYVFKL